MPEWLLRTLRLGENDGILWNAHPNDNNKGPKLYYTTESMPRMPFPGEMRRRRPQICGQSIEVPFMCSRKEYTHTKIGKRAHTTSFIS
jgi:hypothetical protein